MSAAAVVCSEQALDWSIERARWPHAESSTFHQADGLKWHVQQLGAGPALLMVHGTGASTHSWRALAPILARDFRVIMPDLPGHALTEAPPRGGLCLPAMAASLGALLQCLKVEPVAAVGHSAGAAILIRCCLDRAIAPRSLISINGALLPFRGHAGYLFPSLAKLLFLNPLTPRILAHSAKRPHNVDRLIRGTGSNLDAEGIELYGRLFSNPAHVRATLGMMANWDLHALVRDLPSLKTPLLLLAGERDKAVAAADAERVRALVSGAQLVRLEDLGHLAHEENAELVAEHIQRFALDPHRSVHAT